MKIAIVGAGTGGSNIINSLSNVEDVEITMIVDRNLNSPGISLAKNLKLKYSDSMDNINPKFTDIIIEATGNVKVTNILKEKFEDTCTIVDSKAALLLMTLVKKDMQNLENMNNQISLIHDTSSIVQEELDEISSSINDIHNLSSNLLSSTHESYEYIKKSDKIIKYVNEISSKTKMLGINASIEAARAGDEGRGFSVVAKEVQKLATDSANFAKEINHILEQLSGEINRINDEVNKLDSLSDKQISASNNVNTAMSKLLENSKTS